MKIIIPMAGLGKRMRPHTLTIPKPLIPIAGKPIVQRLVEDISRVIHQAVDEIAFVVSPGLDLEVHDQLKEIAGQNGATGKVFVQEEALGTGHAVLCAESALEGNVVVAFADTLFRADFVLDNQADGIIWVNRVDDPSAFGVVQLNPDGTVSRFVEKPQTPVSDLAIIGIYYFRDGANLKKELRSLIENGQSVKGEYQLTDALENMKKAGIRFRTSRVEEWLDCGNKENTVQTNQRILATISGEELVHPSVQMHSSVIIEPCFIGKDVVLTDSVVGPYVSIGNGSTVTRSIIGNSIIQKDTHIRHQIIRNSMIGNSVDFRGLPMEVNLGDFGSFGLDPKL